MLNLRISHCTKTGQVRLRRTVFYLSMYAQFWRQDLARVQADGGHGVEQLARAVRMQRVRPELEPKARAARVLWQHI